MIGDAIRYPKNRENASTNPIFIGGMLVLLSNIPLLSPLLWGYYVRVFKSTIDGEPRPPRFSHWRNLYLYGIPPAIVVFIATMVPMIYFYSVIELLSNTLRASVGPVELFLVFLAFPLGVVSFYFVPASIGTLAYSGALLEAFNPRELLDVALTHEYAKAWFVGVAVYVLGLIALGVVALVPLVGPLLVILLGLFYQFILSTAVAYIFARGYANARGISPDSIVPSTRTDSIPPYESDSDSDTSDVVGSTGRVEGGPRR